MNLPQPSVLWRLSCLSILALALNANALNFNPSDYEAQAGMQITVTWTSSSGDPTTVDMLLISPAKETVGQTPIQANTFFVLYEIPQVAVGDGYRLQFVSAENHGNVLATSQTFSISSKDGQSNGTGKPNTGTTTTSLQTSSTQTSQATTPLPPTESSQSTSPASTSSSGSNPTSSAAASASSSAQFTPAGHHISRRVIVAIGLLAALIPILSALALLFIIRRRRRRRRAELEARPASLRITLCSETGTQNSPAPPSAGLWSAWTRLTKGEDAELREKAQIQGIENLDIPAKGRRMAVESESYPIRREGTDPERDRMALLVGPAGGGEVASLRAQVHALERQLERASEAQRQSVVTDSVPPPYVNVESLV
ncbi:hypothetical protein C8F01DRAFT_1288885 [Mycena amicta]|nr:hypothetical protein C8F01DRAFT_1288885 [Mycena amicta]